jgi:hypothetical protein
LSIMRGFVLQGRIWTRCAAAALACALLAPAALAQGAAPPPAPEQKPGVFQSIGRWFDQGATSFREHLQGAKRKMDDLGDEAAANSKAFGDGAATAGKNAADATKGAVDGLAKLPTARVMNGREKCAIAPNGAPDCGAAAEQLCKLHIGGGMPGPGLSQRRISRTVPDRDVRQPRDVPVKAGFLRLRMCFSENRCPLFRDMR